MKYETPKLNCYYGCVLCSIPHLFVYLRMRMSTSKQYCGSAFEPGYLWVSPVLRLHLCAFRLYSSRYLCGYQTKQTKNGYPQAFSALLWVLFQRNQLVWVNSNNCGFLWVTHQQNTFVWVTLKQKHLLVGNSVTFKFLCG